MLCYIPEGRAVVLVEPPPPRREEEPHPPLPLLRPLVLRPSVTAINMILYMQFIIYNNFSLLS